MLEFVHRHKIYAFQYADTLNWAPRYYFGTKLYWSFLMSIEDVHLEIVFWWHLLGRLHADAMAYKIDMLNRTLQTLSRWNLALQIQRCGVI